MASNVTPIERIAERPMGVDPSAIEDEFTRIWQETSTGGVEESVMRVRVANFVAVAHDDDTAYARFEEIMQSMPQRHPCRGILALATPGRSELQASIAAHCFRSPTNRRHMCSEEVLLHGAPGQERELASVVLALLVPELPVGVWLIGGVEPDSYLVDRLLDAADRVFFDSAESPDVERALRVALNLGEEHDVETVDLAWWRLETWRLLTAQLFDGADGLRELESIESITIRGGQGARSSAPVLLASWLISRLGLTIADATRDRDALTATMYDGSRGVRLSIIPGGQASVEALMIVTDDARFTVECHHESRHMHVIEDWEGGSSRWTSEEPPQDDASVIGVAIDGAEDDAVFEAALVAALELLSAG
jgi:glucose-6-phosphate dehydrogenase assembly protein OpcA